MKGFRNAPLHDSVPVVLTTVSLCELPDDVLVLLLLQLPWRDVARVTGCVSKSWRITGRPDVWFRLARSRDVSMPVISGRGLRSEKDPRRAFFHGAKRQEEYRRAETENLLTGFLQKLKRGEVPRSVLAKLFASEQNKSEAPGYLAGLGAGVQAGVGCAASKCPSSQQREAGIGSRQLDVNHRLVLHSGRTVAFFAAWMGRLKTLQRLVVEFGADLSQEDDNDFSPLAVAAWAGQDKIVRWIVELSGHPYGDPLRRGVPPMTSSCGGKGPFTPLEWVRRKKVPGWRGIEKTLLMAGRGVSEMEDRGDAGAECVRMSKGR
jgi:hypothetical protein